MYHFKFIDKIKLSMRKPYEENFAEFPSHGKIYDNELAEFVMKHLKPWDWLNPYKVTCAVQWGFTCLHDKLVHDADPEETWKQMF